jgi:hypothetical protein
MEARSARDRQSAGISMNTYLSRIAAFPNHGSMATINYAKLRGVSAREIVRALERDGFELGR